MKKKKTICRGTCPCCPQNEDILSMDEVLYNGFGGYHVMMNSELYYVGDPQGDWESFKTLADIEKEVQRINSEFPRTRWKVILNNPLRGATWTRRKGKWVLTDTNQGFA